MNRIPYARGLGSSSAAIVGGIIAGLMLSGHRLSCWGAEELLQIACDIEGHPDNVAPVNDDDDDNYDEDDDDGKC